MELSASDGRANRDRWHTLQAHVQLPEDHALTQHKARQGAHSPASVN